MSTENYLPGVREYLYFYLYIFNTVGRIWMCFSKCRYLISSHSNHWDHTELCYHVSLWCSGYLVGGDGLNQRNPPYVLVRIK